jgi:hypothetical protein
MSDSSPLPFRPDKIYGGSFEMQGILKDLDIQGLLSSIGPAGMRLEAKSGRALRLLQCRRWLYIHRHAHQGVYRACESAT